MALSQNTFVVLALALGALFSVLVVYAPKLRLGGGVVILHGRTVQADADLSGQLELLRSENEKLKEALKASLSSAMKNEVKANNRASAADPTVALPPNVPLDPFSDPTIVPINLAKFLGPYSYAYGISYDPYVCYPSLAVAFPNNTEAAYKDVIDRVLKDLIGEMARIHDVAPEKVKGDVFYHLQPFNAGKFPTEFDDAIRAVSADPKYQEWRRHSTRVMARYLCDAFGNLHIRNNPGNPACTGISSKQNLADLGKLCTDFTWEHAVAVTGYFPIAFEALNRFQMAIKDGTCFTHARNNRESYAHWIVKERMSPAWKTFNVENLDQDKVMLLFDMLYEKGLVFAKQYWMGVVTMQNPFDMYSIQDIIYSTKPDLLIETGTANGGSALMWAGIMELVGLEGSKIVTVDVTSPEWKDAGGGAGWGGGAVAREDPTKNRLWKKRVSFIKGYTTEPKVLDQIRAAAANKSSIMVTLDSGHNEHHVADEMDKYCPYVTVGSYCIVEDTKMSRWHSTGPLEAVKAFLVKHPEFQMDRSREFLYSHHTMGYLKRIR